MKPISVFGTYSYEEKVQELTAYNQKELIEVFEKIEELKKKYYCLGFLTYEAYKCFDTPSFHSSKPLAYFGVFRSRTPYTPP